MYAGVYLMCMVAFSLRGQMSLVFGLVRDGCCGNRLDFGFVLFVLVWFGLVWFGMFWCATAG